jgi:hypothetical protein
MEAIYCSETSDSLRSTGRYNPENRTFQTLNSSFKATVKFVLEPDTRGDSHTRLKHVGLYDYLLIKKCDALDQWYSTWGTRRHLRRYVKLKKNIYII